MNKNVNPVAAILTLLFFIGLIALAFHFNQQNLKMDRLSLITIDQSNRLVIQYGNRLFHFTPQTGTVETTELTPLDVKENTGGFAFFSNGDVLIRKGDNQLSPSEEASVVLREENTDYSPNKRNSLYRCNLSTLNCQLFSNKLPGFNRTFRLFIDHDNATDTVYLADTSRHRIQKFDNTGKLLATKKGFEFPNQLALIDNKLWLADTNHHRIVALSHQTDSYGEVLEEHITKLNSKHIWPAAFTKVNDQWWVLVMDSGMKDGRIVRFTKDWQKLDELHLPKDADPLALAALENSVVITDNRTFTLYRFGFDGERLPDLEVSGLSEILSEAKSTSQQLQLYSNVCWALFIIALMIGVYIAIRQSLAEKTELEVDAPITELEAIPPTGIWLKSSLLFRSLTFVLGFCLLSIIALISLIPSLIDNPPPISFYLTFFALTASMSLIIIPLHRISKWQLGILPEHIELIDHNGAHHKNNYDKVVYNKRMFTVSEYAIPLGQKGGASIFSRKIIETHIFPRLKNSNKVNDLQMLKRQWHSPEGIIKYSFTLLISMLLITAYLPG